MKLDIDIKKFVSFKIGMRIMDNKASLTIKDYNNREVKILFNIKEDGLYATSNDLDDNEIEKLMNTMVECADTIIINNLSVLDILFDDCFYAVVFKDSIYNIF